MSLAAAGETLEWSLGLINSAGKYLTAETFQHKVICAAASMKRKQIFFLEQVPGKASVRIRTVLNCYLSVDDDGGFHGNVTAEDKEQESTEFEIIAQADGKWCLRTTKMGWYVKSTGETMSAFTTDISEESKFTVHLAMHPQINIKNVQRKAYMHLNDGGDAIHTDEVIPWGHDATITLSSTKATIFSRPRTAIISKDLASLFQNPPQTQSSFSAMTVLEFRSNTKLQENT